MRFVLVKLANLIELWLQTKQIFNNQMFLLEEFSIYIVRWKTESFYLLPNW